MKHLGTWWSLLLLLLRQRLLWLLQLVVEVLLKLLVLEKLHGLLPLLILFLLLHL